MCILNDRKSKEADLQNFPQTDIIILSEKALFDPAILRKSFPSSVVIENRSQFKIKQVNDSQLIATNDYNYLNTTIGGAVQITFDSGDKGEKNILSSGYFNR